MPKINASPMDIAHFRFALIAPVIQGTFFEPSASAYYRKVTQKPLTLPDGSTFLYNPKTLEKWTEYYNKRGMDGLMPKIRSDKVLPGPYQIPLSKKSFVSKNSSPS